jgi:hypothetical protein
MAIYIQQSVGNYDLIREALQRDIVDGVIYSPRGDQPPTLRAAIIDMNEFQKDLLFDPLFYVSTIERASDRNLRNSYTQYYRARRTMESFDDDEQIRRDARETLITQENFRLTHSISPTVAFSSFDDDWARVAGRLADASLRYGLESSSTAPPRPLLLSFVFDESALSSRRLMDEFIDELTRKDVYGVYLIVVRNEVPYTQGFEPERLVNYLRMIYSLAMNNGLKVVCGYTDFVGILFRAVGASAIGVGWTQGTRRFIQSTFRERPDAIRSTPSPRYSSTPLMSSLRYSDLARIYEADASLYERILSGGPTDSLLQSQGLQNDSWSLRISEIQHWEALSRLDRSLSDNPGDNLDSIQARIANAIDLYSVIMRERIIEADDTHLHQWKRAIDRFRSVHGV